MCLRTAELPKEETAAQRGEVRNGELLMLMASLLHTRSPSCRKPNLPISNFSHSQVKQTPQALKTLNRSLTQGPAGTFTTISVPRSNTVPGGQVSSEPSKSLKQKQPAQKHKRATREKQQLCRELKIPDCC